MKKYTTKEIEVVFRYLKTEVLRRVSEFDTQQDAEKATGIQRAELSLFLRGKKRFSEKRLLEILKNLEQPKATK